jgi:gamma-glutamyltranspeptidase/glutathione hydrolase
MAFGTEGGDSQDQWTLQFFLNHVDFGMNLQEAVDAPTVHSAHCPSSFYPRDAFPARVYAENRIDAGVLDELRKRGHEVILSEGYSHGRVMAVKLNRKRGVLSAAASPKGINEYAIGW